MLDSQAEQRKIHCSGCQEQFWLRYQYTDKKPMTAVGIACPHPSCRKLNRVYMPASATGVEVSEEATEPATASPPDVPLTKAPPAPPESPTTDPEAPRRRNRYSRPPRF